MEKANDFEHLIKMIADLLSVNDTVYYDVETLEYDGILDNLLWEYEDYLELSDEDIAKIPDEELRDWQRDTAIALKRSLQLKSHIDKPHSSIAFRWMEAFTEDHADNQKFFRDAIKALRNRHPFRGFRAALDWNGLTDEWYPFRDTKMQDYVRKEIEPINEDDIE